MSTVIKVENIAKQYRLGDVSTGALAHDVNKWWHKVRGKENPYLKIGETNDRSVKGESDYVWALKDINFEVKQGEVLGIIGRNGAGKSTLLKILSKTTTPTTGSIKIKGRIASLLEVGTGFHPELSGRDNIFLNGAILGMTKREIKNKFDEIVDFAGVERYIDTPVKRYSSGMYVRLAFGVAAYLEPDILIVDEVLAVGDAEFQKKALGKMKDVSSKDGRTVLFVSHNMQAIQNLCSTCMYMEKGDLIDKGNPQEILQSYLQKNAENYYLAGKEKEQLEVFLAEANLENEKIFSSKSILIYLKIHSSKIVKVSIDLRIISSLSLPVAFASIGTFNYEDQIELKPGYNELKFEIFLEQLAIGDYNISVDITEPNIKYYDRCDECLGFEILKTQKVNRQLEQNWNYGFFQLDVKKV